LNEFVPGAIRLPSLEQRPHPDGALLNFSSEFRHEASGQWSPLQEEREERYIYSYITQI